MSTNIVPRIAVVVVCYKMNRELPRTLLSLSLPYQRDIERTDYEVVVVDNGSPEPPSVDDFAHLDLNLRIIHQSSPTPSPVSAINNGVAHTDAPIVCVYIDGARIASPRLLATAREALLAGPRVFVGSRGRYLGPKFQRESMLEGYDQAAEDLLLAESDWTNDGYRLFERSVFDESSGPTWFDPVAESNSLFMWRTLFDELGGFESRFTSAGGGLVNLDAWRRACEAPDTIPTLLLGEATFHQVHGGVATNGTLKKVDDFYTEYFQIHGREFEVPMISARYVGRFVVTPPNKEILEVHPGPNVKARRTLPGRRTLGHLARRLSPRQQRRLAELVRRTRLLVTLRWREHRNEREAAAEITASGLFDPEWYLNEYPEVADAGWNPAVHYVRLGPVQGRQPGPNFDAVWYLTRYKDVATAGAHPLLHYLRHGKPEGRRIRSGLRGTRRS